MSLTKLNYFDFSRFGIGIRIDNPVDQMIDYCKTLFYSSDVYEQGIYFNSQAESVKLKKMGYEAELKKIEEKISDLRDPTNGELFVDEILRRENVYWGPCVNQAPDLLLKMKNYGYLLNKSIPIRGNRFLKEVTGPEGCHRSNGIFAAYGHNIMQKTNLDASIMDLTPTVLYTLDMALPEDLDGKPLTNIFTSDFKDKTQLRFSEEHIFTEMKNNSDDGYNRDEEKEIRSRLKELGYLD
jgi:predicted AlkP superfamily phosphohydrolase/phosphomutase